ncbi:MAG: hypothetical protein ABSG74_11800 [Candidatus Bathyarchaeia archaeon]
MIRRARIDSIVEMALESIAGMKLTGLSARDNITVQNGHVGAIEKLIALERTIIRAICRSITEDYADLS